MGIEDGEASTGGCAPAARWSWHLGGRRSGAAALLGGGSGATVTSAREAQSDRSPREAWAACCSHISWLHALIAGSTAVIALELVRPIAYHFPTLRAAAETLMTLLALAGAWLARGQFAHTRRLRDALLLGALLTLALIEFLSDALPAALELRSGSFPASALPWGQLLVAAMFVASASAPADRLIAGGRRPVAIAAALGVAAFAAAELGALLLHATLFGGAADSGSGIGRALSDPLAFVLAVAAAGAFAHAAGGFARRGRLERDDVASLLAGAAILLAAARLYYLALPWVLPDSIAPREGLRVLAFALVFAALARQELQLRAGMARAAAMAERRRVARDLHDGIAQDLAFIAAHGTRMAEQLGGEHPVALAARRALAVSRGTISELSDLSSSPPHEVLEAIAHELRARFEIAIAVDARVDAELAPDTREQVARIAREAIANAARHGGAQNVVVSLKRTSTGLALRVCDDGCGMRDQAPGGSLEGFGLLSMRERAAALGGHLTVRPRSSGGVELEVVLP